MVLEDIAGKRNIVYKAYIYIYIYSQIANSMGSV